MAQIHSTNEFIEIMASAGHEVDQDGDGAPVIYRWVAPGGMGTTKVRHMHLSWPVVGTGNNSDIEPRPACRAWLNA